MLIFTIDSEENNTKLITPFIITYYSFRLVFSYVILSLAL